jgi:hypothetical protein
MLATIASCTAKANLSNSDIICEKVACNDGKHDFVSKQCSHFDITDLTYYVKPCEDNGYTCGLAFLLGDDFCAPNEPFRNTNHSGEACNDDSECVLGTDSSNIKCVENICVGYAIDEECNNTSHCAPGSYCSDDKCTAVLADGDDCTLDEQCASNSICLHKSKTTLQCTKMLSLPSSETSTVYNCFDTGYVSLACESLRCNASSSTAEDGRCIEAGTQTKRTPCSSDDECVVSTSFGETMTLECKCGHDVDGNSYCQVSFGDNEYSDFMNLIKEVVDSDSSVDCNAKGKLTAGCVKAIMGSQTYEEYLYYVAEGANWPLHVNNDDCVIGVLDPIYYNGDNPDDDDDDSVENLYLGLFSLFPILG